MTKSKSQVIASFNEKFVKNEKGFMVVQAYPVEEYEDWFSTAIDDILEEVRLKKKKSTMDNDTGKCLGCGTAMTNDKDFTCDCEVYNQAKAEVDKNIEEVKK